MPSRTLATLAIVAAGAFAPAAAADAASKKASKFPTIKKISPMTVSIGETMTLTGSGYIKGKGKNTVAFRRSGKRTIFVKADGLSSTRLSVVVPEKLRSSLGKKNGAAVATRFQLRVLAKRFGKGYTALKNSPMVLPAAKKAATTAPKTTTPVAPPAPVPVAKSDPPPPPANCDGDGLIDDVDPDDDNDLIADTTENTIKTNRCLPDTDGDGMEDGWEYQSAVDLNQRSCPKPPLSTDASFDYPRPCNAAMPYPGKKPYQNPLVADNNLDHDADWVPAWAEHEAWLRKGRADGSYRALVGARGMWYSAGKRASVDTASDVPVDNDCVGLALPDNGLPFGGVYNRPEFEIGEGTGNYPDLDSAGVVLDEYEYLTLRRDDGNVCLDDSERDEDGDFLSNFEELTGPMSSPDWWAGVYEEPTFRPEHAPYIGTDWLDRDSDGDDTWDGLDDQDGDDFLNIEEIDRGAKTWTEKSTGPGALDAGLWVHAFNPCLPNPRAKTCPTRRPVGDPAAWAPYSEDVDNVLKERWPLYANPLYGWAGPFTPLAYPVTYTVDDGPDPDTDPDVVQVPAEVWSPDPADMPPGYDPTTMPPLHPLPRPELDLP